MWENCTSLTHSPHFSSIWTRNDQAFTTNKQKCDLDPIHTILLKQLSSLLVTTIKNVNLSISTGTYPFAYKSFIITPLLKITSLHKKVLNIFRPISNLSLISKFTERIIKSQLQDHLSSSFLYNPNESAYKKNHSTETTQLPLHDHFIITISHQQISCLCHCLWHFIIIFYFKVFHPGLASWFNSYLSSLSFSANASGSTSSHITFTCGKPHGLVLDMILFNMYTTLLSILILSSSLNHYLYADDMQLFTSLFPRTSSLLSANFKIPSWQYFHPCLPTYNLSIHSQLNSYSLSIPTSL